MKTRLLRTAAAALCFAILATSASAVTFDWTNAQSDNDFSNLNNWTSGGSPPPSFTSADDYYVNLSGGNRAELSTSLGGTVATGIPDDVRVGSGATGELLISGGVNYLNNTFRVGLSGGTGTVEITGGSLNVLNSYTTFADGGTAIVTMTGGTLNCDRQTWAQQAGAVATLNMSGGTINIDYSDATPPSTTASLRMGAGDAALNISGTALINTRKFYIAEGGLLTMDGGTINITGADTADPEPTFNFTEPDIALMLGQIEYNAGSFNVTGDWESLLDAAIDAGNIYTTQPNVYVDAVYSSGTGLTTLTLVPEPSTLVLLAGGLLALAFYRRRQSK